MAKTVLGIDIGQDTMKLALCKGGQIRKLVSVAMPKNMIKEGWIVSSESMGELIRNTMKKNKIHASLAALALSNETCYVRTIAMPIMSAEQLELNIPYEFNDYITDELKNYVFDYAMISTPQDLMNARLDGRPLPFDSGMGKGKRASGKKRIPFLGRRKGDSAEETSASGIPAEEPGGNGLGEGEGAALDEDNSASPTMELMAAAVRTSVLDESRDMLRRAGLKLYRAAPALCGYISLIRNRGSSGGSCILDLGFQSIRMYMFQGDRHVATRVLETGLSVLDEAIADAASVDIHLAHTYLLNNYGNCQNLEFSINAYNNIAVELIRALNFYNFSNPDSNLTDAWLCGGGAAIPPLREAIVSALELHTHPAAELVPGGLSMEESHNYLGAIGIAMEA